MVSIKWLFIPSDTQCNIASHLIFSLQRFNACLYSQCIASTTLDEHRLHFEKDKALARRFQPVYVNEPSQVVQNFNFTVTRDSWVSASFNFPSCSLQEDAVKILLGLREKYETYHKCKYTLEGINAAVYLDRKSVV